MNHHHQLPSHLDHQVSQSSYCDTTYLQQQQQQLQLHHANLNSQLAVAPSQRMRMDQQQLLANHQVTRQDAGQQVGYINYQSGCDLGDRQQHRVPSTYYSPQHQVCAPTDPNQSYMQNHHLHGNELGNADYDNQLLHPNLPYNQNQVYTSHNHVQYLQQTPVHVLQHHHHQQQQQQQQHQHHQQRNHMLLSRQIAVSQAQQQFYQPHQHHQPQYNVPLHQHQLQYQQHPCQANDYTAHLNDYPNEISGVVESGPTEGDEYSELLTQGESFYQAESMDLHPTLKQQEEARRLEQQQSDQTANLMSVEMSSTTAGQQPYEQQQMLGPQSNSALVHDRSPLTVPQNTLVQQQQQQQFVSRSKSDLDASAARGQYSPDDCQPRPLSNAGHHLDHTPGHSMVVSPPTSVANGDQQAVARRQQRQQEQYSELVDLRSCGNLSQDWLDSICRHLIEHMNRFGICVIDNFLGNSKGDLILKEVRQLYNSGQYSRGRLVSSNKLTSRTLGDRTGTIRNDRVIWIDGYEDGCSEINNLIQTLCSVITNSSRLSLYSNNGLDKVLINKRTKAHVACYPGNGTRYIKHVDNPNDDGRVITCIYYLNKDWNTKLDGGLLRMFPVGMDQVANIEPLFDRVLFFWSDRRNPHEVLPAYKDRFAITVWYIGENRPI